MHTVAFPTPSVYDYVTDLDPKVAETNLSTVEGLNITSLAIPAISSGIFGMDKDSVAEVIFSTLVDSMHKCTADDKLSDIRIVIFDEETYYPFQRFAVTFRNSMIQSTEVWRTNIIN